LIEKKKKKGRHGGTTRKEIWVSKQVFFLRRKNDFLSHIPLFIDRREAQPLLIQISIPEKLAHNLEIYDQQ